MNDYTSVCCKVPAIKPHACEKQSVVNPETKKAKSVSKGLGHWRCTSCKKCCSVTVSKHKEAEMAPVQAVTIG